MSVHGICYDNGQSGNCNCECELFEDGGCDAAGDVIENLYAGMSDAEVNEIIEETIEPVKLFTLRGAGASTIDLLYEIFGY